MMYKSKIKNMQPEPQPNDAVKADELPSAQVEQNPMLYAVFSFNFDKWEKAYNPNYFIDGGRTIPYDFHLFCSEMWGQIRHQRGTSFEMFREQMLNTATSWQNSLKTSLWEVCIINHRPGLYAGQALLAAIL